MAITREDIKSVLEDYGVVTEKSLGKALEDYGVATKKDLNKVKKELQGSIASIAFNSPTANQFDQLEKRVSKIEASAN